MALQEWTWAMICQFDSDEKAIFTCPSRSKKGTTKLGFHGEAATLLDGI